MTETQRTFCIDCLTVCLENLKMARDNGLEQSGIILAAMRRLNELGLRLQKHRIDTSPAERRFWAEQRRIFGKAGLRRLLREDQRAEDGHE